MKLGIDIGSTLIGMHLKKMLLFLKLELILVNLMIIEIDN